MAEPFSFFDTTLDKPKEDYTSALLGKKPKENAFASPQVNPMMAQTQILGQAPVAQAPMPVVQPQVAPATLGPAAPTPEQMYNMGPSTAYSDFDLAWQGRNSSLRGGTPTDYARTPEQEAAAAERARMDRIANQVEGAPAPTLLSQILATPGQMGKNADEFLGSAMRYFTPKEELGYTPPTGGDVLATAGIRAPGGDVFGSPGRTEAITKPQDKKVYDQLAAGERAFATGEGLGSAPSVMGSEVAASPMAGTAAAPVTDMAPIDPNSPQANFLMQKERLGGQPMTNDQIARATRLATSMGTTFDPETGYSRDAFLAGEPAPRPNNLTTVGGTPLNEFLSGAAMPDQGFARAENAMYGDNSQSRGLGGDVATKAFQDASMAREARLGFDNRPGVDVPSLAMQEQRMAAGLDPIAGAPMGTELSQEQQRARLANGIDPATGQPIQSGDDGMTPYQRASLQWQKDKFSAEQAIEGYDKALETAESAEEKAKIKTEMETKERDLYSMHQDGFERQERYIEQALKNTGKMSTGGGSIFKFIPGSKASDLNESLKPILGEAAFGRLQQMREASKTGGALGAISERELDLLQSAMGALNSSQSESQFRSNLLAYQKQLRESNKRMKEAYNAQFGNGQAGSGQAGGSASPRYSNDQDAGGSIEDILLPKSK